MTVELVGDDLRKARKAAGYTQRALGDLLGISGSAVGQWETGVTRPQWTQSVRLRQILGGPQHDDEQVSRAEFNQLRDLVRKLALAAEALGLELDDDDSLTGGATPAAPVEGEDRR